MKYVCFISCTRRRLCRVSTKPTAKKKKDAVTCQHDDDVLFRVSDLAYGKNKRLCDLPGW